MSSLWLRRFHPAPSGAPRLVCFPHAGGSASFFFPLSKALSPSVEVLAVQYPGRQDRRAEGCIDTIADLADQISGALREWTDHPIFLFGHSMGAIIAFEAARRLEQAGGPAPTGLFASGRRAPSRYRVENVHQHDDDGIVRELQLLSGTDSRLLGDGELLRMILPAVRGDYKAIETYRCDDRATVDCPVTVLTGDVDPRTTIQEACAWREHTTGTFDLRVFSGGHFFLTAHQAEIIKMISAKLTSASRE